MRISDWSSDVCSSDLIADLDTLVDLQPEVRRLAEIEWRGPFAPASEYLDLAVEELDRAAEARDLAVDVRERSEERRVGQEGVITCRSRWSPSHSKKTHKHTNLASTTIKQRQRV